MSLPHTIIKHLRHLSHPLFLGIFVVVLVSLGSLLFASHQTNTSLTSENNSYKAQLASTNEELNTLKARDEYKINEELKKEVDNIQQTYNLAVTTYEDLLAFQESHDDNDNIPDLEKGLAQALTYLSEKNYSSASALLISIGNTIESESQTVAESFSIPTNVAVNNAPPSSGSQRQQVQTEIGNYLVDIVSADLGSTRVIVDTASDGTCTNDCPVLSLGDYVSRNSAFAGINGSYFCPASYPSCQGKTNSFDTLLMNKNKTYFNSDNNVYSTVPVVVFGNGWIRFIGRSLDWGRATDVDGVIANQPLLVSGGNVVFGGDGDPKKGSKGSRSFVADKANTIYIGVIHNVTVEEAAIVLKTLGMENALNLDSGGSTALWSGGYKVGPGRNIPNAILFIRK